MGIMVVLHWNGAELPTELVSLPPGRYVVEPVDSGTVLSEHEEAGLLRALDSLERGEGVDQEDLDARVASLLGSE